MLVLCEGLRQVMKWSLQLSACQEHMHIPIRTDDDRQSLPPPLFIIHYLFIIIIIIRTTCKLLTVTASISAQTSNLGAIYTVSYGVQSEKSAAHQQHHSLLAATCSFGLPLF